MFGGSNKSLLKRMLVPRMPWQSPDLIDLALESSKKTEPARATPKPAGKPSHTPKPARSTQKTAGNLEKPAVSSRAK